LSRQAGSTSEQLTILALVTELLGDGETSKGDTGTGSRGLVHLTEDKGDLGLAIKLNDGGLLHLVVQIVTLTGTLADTGEDGVTTVGLCDVVDQLLNEDGLADTGTTEETNLSTTGVGSEKVDDLDTSNENLGGGRLLDELGGLGVNGKVLVGLDGTALVDRVTGDVHDAAKGGDADTVRKVSTVFGVAVALERERLLSCMHSRDGDGSTGYMSSAQVNIGEECMGQLTIGCLVATDKTLST